ncbi:putative glyoxalase superfamily protein PhnB [Stenotrophomonas maltophilia]|nr:putative glyoxalase superfamily protein PhnB [Stenotrophomonas maltophilia]
MGENGQPSSGSTIIPFLRYRDAQAAIDWLQRAFGFHAQAVYADGDTVFHAQLTFGTGMIMLGSASNQSAWSEHAAMPDEVAAARRRVPA